MTAAALPALIARIVDVLPELGVRSLGSAVSAHDRPSGACLVAMHQAVSGAKAPGLVTELHSLWLGRPDLEGRHIALLLDTARQTLGRVTQRQSSVEIVWTGPVSDTASVPVRLTREVFIEVVQSAGARLLVVSFAAFKDTLITTELLTAASRGVQVRVVLESSKIAGGTSSGDPQQALAGLEGHVSFYIWPAERRPVLAHGMAAMHAKAVVADDHTALVSSANLTGHALTQNMELGIKLIGGAAPRDLAAHFRALMSSGLLTPVSS